MACFSIEALTTLSRDGIINIESSRNPSNTQVMFLILPHRKMRIKVVQNDHWAHMQIRMTVLITLCCALRGTIQYLDLRFSKHEL